MGSSRRGRLDVGSGDGESSDEDGSMFNRSMEMICGGWLVTTLMWARITCTDRFHTQLKILLLI
jgi:hypothetical protein